MRTGATVLVVALSAVAVAALAGCSSAQVSSEAASNSPSAALADTATVTYAFTDSSVPPQYHRSFSLTVTQDETAIVVDSYGDVLAEDTVSTPPSVWAALDPAALENLTITSNEQGCTGGTSTRLTVVDGSAALVDLQVEECGGLNDVAASVIDDWIAPARALLPAIDELAPSEE